MVYMFIISVTVFLQSLSPPTPRPTPFHSPRSASAAATTAEETAIDESYGVAVVFNEEEEDVSESSLL